MGNYQTLPLKERSRQSDEEDLRGSSTEEELSSGIDEPWTDESEMEDPWDDRRGNWSDSDDDDIDGELMPIPEGLI